MVAIARQGGAFFDDPRMLPKSYDVSAQLHIANSSGTDSAASVSGFWTELGNRGVAVDSNFTAGTAKQVLSVSGPAILRGVIGPTASGADTTTFTIVVDNVTYTIASVTLANTYRAFIGCFMDGVNDGTLFGTTVTTNYIAGRGALDATKTWIDSSSNSIRLPGETILDMIGGGGVIARQSLTVSITHSASISATANQERQSGVWYRAL